NGLAKAQQFAFRSHDRGLLGKKFLPTKTEVLKLLLKREPSALMPAQTVFHRIAVLHERFFDFLAHLRGRRSAERSHLAVPAHGQLSAQVCKARQRVQCAKMLEQARATATHLCRVNELAPGLVREQRKRAEFAALFEMAKRSEEHTSELQSRENLVCRLLLEKKK